VSGQASFKVRVRWRAGTDANDAAGNTAGLRPFLAQWDGSISPPDDGQPGDVVASVTLRTDHSLAAISGAAGLVQAAYERMGRAPETLVPISAEAHPA
jgi:hypothetical protein